MCQRPTGSISQVTTRTFFSYFGHCLGALPMLVLAPGTNTADCHCSCPTAEQPYPCPLSGETMLLALSAKGRLMTCSLSCKTPGPTRMTAASADRKIKELLSGIGDVSER